MPEWPRSNNGNALLCTDILDRTRPQEIAAGMLVIGQTQFDLIFARFDAGPPAAIGFGDLFKTLTPEDLRTRFQFLMRPLCFLQTEFGEPNPNMHTHLCALIRWYLDHAGYKGTTQTAMEVPDISMPLRYIEANPEFQKWMLDGELATIAMVGQHRYAEIGPHNQAPIMQIRSGTGMDNLGRYLHTQIFPTADPSRIPFYFNLSLHSDGRVVKLAGDNAKKVQSAAASAAAATLPPSAPPAETCVRGEPGVGEQSTRTSLGNNPDAPGTLLARDSDTSTGITEESTSQAEDKVAPENTLVKPLIWAQQGATREAPRKKAKLNNEAIKSVARKKVNFANTPAVPSGSGVTPVPPRTAQGGGFRVYGELSQALLAKTRGSTSSAMPNPPQAVASSAGPVTPVQGGVDWALGALPNASSAKSGRSHSPAISISSEDSISSSQDSGELVSNNCNGQSESGRKDAAPARNTGEGGDQVGEPVAVDLITTPSSTGAFSETTVLSAFNDYWDIANELAVQIAAARDAF